MGVRRWCRFAPCGALALLLACSSGPSASSDASASTPSTSLTGTLSSPAASAEQDDGQWVMPAKDYASTRYSQLDEISVDNVSALHVAWTFSTGAIGGHEAAPLVVGNSMFIITPFPNTVFALDLSKPGAPVKWSYEPKPLSAAKGVACCDVVNRGVGYWNGRVIFNTLDDRTIALDAETGARIWETPLGDYQRGETMTMAPLVVKDEVIVGNSGGEFGVRGWAAALSAETGEIRWRAYSTGPDRDVLIGPDFAPPYPQDRGTDLGVSSWPPDAWRIGGGNVWGWISYDPALDLIYYGTGNPGPWNPEQRPGDNKWTAGVFARDPDTGQARWFYQFSPHDLFDHDGVNENLLLDLTIGSTVRHVLVRPDRNGYIYVLDRATGTVLSATPFVHITSSHGVDLATGRLIPEKAKEPSPGTVVHDICPASPGAKDWQPSSFSPQTGLIYIPHNNLCMDFEAADVSYIAGTPYIGAETIFKAGPGGNQGALTAWDPVAGKAVWTIPEAYPAWSGTLATAGGLVFYGTMDGWFKAVDARTGQVLWRFKTGSGIVGQPVTYRGPDNHQYVAILAGVGGWPGAVVVNHLDTRDATAAAGWGAAMANLKSDTTRGGTLYVFAVEGT